MWKSCFPGPGRAQRNEETEAGGSKNSRPTLNSKTQSQNQRREEWGEEGRRDPDWLMLCTYALIRDASAPALSGSCGHFQNEPGDFLPPQGCSQSVSKSEIWTHGSLVPSIRFLGNLAHLYWCLASVGFFPQQRRDCVQLYPPGAFPEFWTRTSI